MITTRPGTVLILGSDRYVCSRCGIERECTGSRPKPKLCSDCTSVLAYREPEPPKPKPVLPEFTREEQLEGRRAYNAGQRDPETVARYRAYERARNRKGRAA